MGKATIDRQKSIEDWFDHTYTTRGAFYLRPVKAYYIFLELLKARPNHKLLDVACGLGRLLEAGQEYACQLYGIDLSSVAVKKAQKKLPNATILKANAEQLPFPVQYFDYLTCLGSLERMINEEKALREMSRVLKDNGKLCILVRNANSFSWKFVKSGLGLKNREGNQGAKNLTDWTALFERNGLVIEKVLPDQYPLHKKRRWSSLGLRKVDYKKPLDSSRPLEEANEFIFILRKK